MEANEKRPPCDGFLCRVRWQKNLAEPLHDCPFQRDVNGKPDFSCNCCDACRQNCADDI